MRARRDPSRRSLIRDERGLSAAEYIILLALICVVGFIAWRIFGARTRERTHGAHGVVSGLATTSSADGESGAGHAGGANGASGGAEHAPPVASTAPGAAPHGGAGDIQRGQHMQVGGGEGEFGEDEEARRSRLRSRNVRWIFIAILTAGVLAVLVGKKRR
jgi:hypothetical protein